MASERLFNKRASQHLPCLVSPPENKYVRILTSVLFQICQYSLIGQVDLPRALQAPNRLFWFHCRASTQSFRDRGYSLLNRSLCKFGILSKDLQQSTQRGIISNQARRPGSRPIRR